MQEIIRSIFNDFGEIMDEVKKVDMTLTKNKIKQFIIRVNLLRSDKLDFVKLVGNMSRHFNRTEKREIKSFSIDFTQNISEGPKEINIDYVLINEKDKYSLTFSEFQKAFWIESSYYVDNSFYKELMPNIISELNKFDEEGIQSKRIGLRYVNEFECRNVDDIKSIFSNRLTKVMGNMLLPEKQSRIIGVEEYNHGDYKQRLQYGVPNKFYPSVVSVFDLLLDIDTYVDIVSDSNEWEDVIRILNHASYEKFEQEINKKYLLTLK